MAGGRGGGSRPGSRSMGCLFYEAQREGRPGRSKSAVIGCIEGADEYPTGAGQATESTSHYP